MPARYYITNKIRYSSLESKIFYSIMGVATAMVGYTIHGSMLWAIVNWFFWPLSLIVWLITKEINLTVIKTTFEFLAQ